MTQRITSEPARVLLVDDDQALLDALPNLIGLRIPGTIVDVCDSAPQAAQQVRSNDYDAIIITKEAFESIPLKPEAQERFLNRELGNLRAIQAERDRFEIIAGERRWRAAQRVGLHDVPVIVIEANDREALEIAIVENVQRADLEPLEEAAGYQQLIDEFEYSQERLSSVIVKGSRPESRIAGASSPNVRGSLPSAALAIAAMCSGVVPQQPPTRLTSPASADSAMIAAVSSGASSYSPNALGRPAFG